MLGQFDREKVIRASLASSDAHTKKYRESEGQERIVYENNANLLLRICDAARAAKGGTVTMSHDEFALMSGFWE